jgi:MinD-like ATPase involved in chromosome partitioning or flagellar assembly
VSQAEEALDKKVSYYLPDDPGRVNRAINKGVPVVLRHPWSKLARSVKSMARSLNGQYAESDRPLGARDR